MDIKQIQDLIRFVSKSGVNEVSIEQSDFKITIKTNQVQAVPNYVLPEAHHFPAPIAPVAVASPVTATPPAAEPADDASKYVIIKSPMIGTFYRSASPKKPIFVNVGEEIKPGSVLCIIEAMKLFNEIESEISGKVVKILADNASPVEYDQPLFLVEPM